MTLQRTKAIRRQPVARLKFLRRQLRLESLESRSLMCNDLAELGVDSLDAENGTLNSLLHMDAAAISTLLAAAAPSTLGVFTLSAMTYTTLANGMPILNSLPSAPTSIFLDLDGDAVTDTDPYDEDGNPATFNVTEQKNIAEAWRQISTYFAMFDTNVTTVPPATPKAWLASGNNISGGYSYVGVFPNSKPQSFNQSSNVRTRVSGLAHELGHNFGLSHQSDFDLLGEEIRDYSSGYDSLHGPIMGVDYAQSVHKWIIGHTNSASTLQNDINVIAGKIDNHQPAGGDGFRADDFGNTIATAKILASDEDVYATSGIIERLNDVDAFAFGSLGTPITVSAFPDKPSGVDLKLEIYDALGTLMASKDATTNDQEITLTLPVGTFYILLSSHKNYGDVGTYNLTIRPLPTQWTARDIGSVGVEGFSQYDSTTQVFTIAGSGADIAGTADEMQFAMQPLTGDGTIIARVASMSNTNTAAKSGLEIREGTASNAKHVALVQTFGSGQQWITRETAGAASVSTGAAAQSFAPKWLKLTRVGNIFTGYVSNDGIVWTQKGTQTISMNSKVQIGLIASAKNDSALNIATFDQVSVTGNLGNAPPVYNELAVPGNLNVSRSTGSNLNIAWTDGVGETGYRIERSVDGVNFTTAGTTAAGVATYDDLDLFGSLRYYYRVKALSGTTTSAPSLIDTAVNRPNAVTNLEVTSLTTTQTVLNWRDTHGENGYRIERSPDGVSFTQIGTVGMNVPSYTDTDLTTATVYSYRVTPTSNLGDGEPLVVSGSTRLAKVGGIAFDAVAATAIQFHWNNIAAEQNFRIERSTDGTSFTTLATVAANITTYTDTTVSAVKEYYYRVVGVNSLTESVNPSNTIFTATPSATALPAPWESSDIGATNGDGAASHSAGVFKVISSGVDIGGTADGFRFTYQALNGDGSITARIATQENTADNAKQGVMIRETLAADSKRAAVLVQAVDGIVMRSRSTVGGADTSTSGPIESAPYWVRMTRVGNVFTSYTSVDGATWTQFASKTISMTSKVFVGLAASATSTTLLNTGTFDNVAVVGNAVVTNRRIFYNGSTSLAFGSGTGNPLNAIDSTKVALLPGQTSSTAHYTNYVRGLNGIIIDIDGLVSAVATDFQFATWDGIDAAGFTALAVTPTVATFEGGGLNGATRVKLVFPDNAIRNTWLRVTVLANAHTDLLDDDVFYFGNAVADIYSGNVGTPITVRTNATDTSSIRSNQSVAIDSVPVTNAFDVNKDGRVNATDTSLSRQNQAASIIRYFMAPVNLQQTDAIFASDLAAVLAPMLDSDPSSDSYRVELAAPAVERAMDLGTDVRSKPRFVSEYPAMEHAPQRQLALQTDPVTVENQVRRRLDHFYRSLGIMRHS